MNELVAWLQPRLGDLVADLRDLVDVDCGTHDKAGVDVVGSRFAAMLERAGFEVDVLPVPAFGDCLQATLRGSGSGRVLLLGHLDTVYPTGTAADRPMRVMGDRIVGPGTNDMKAGLLAGLYSVAALRATGFDDFEQLTFFCNSEEEVGSPVSRELYADSVRSADAAFVLEAARSDGSIVSARKGGGRFRLVVTGRSAHAGVEPEKGANAVHELACRVCDLMALDGMRPGTTVGVGVVHGGTRANVVPDRAEAEIDVRVAGSADMADVEAALRAVAARTTVRGTSAELSGAFGMMPMVRTAAVGALAERAREIAARLGFDLREVATGGMSDANRVAAMGTPVLDGLGPVGGLDHSPDEYVELRSIVPRTALLAGLVRAALADRRLLADLARADDRDG